MEDDLVRATFEIEGRADHVRTIEFLLAWIAQCGIEGATRTVQLMVDGDGAAIIDVTQNGKALELVGETREFAMGERKETPPSLRDLCAEWREDVLMIDIA